MKRTIKGFVLIVVITTLLMSTALGAGVRETIEVAFNAVNLTVNGNKVDADTIVYEGTTYVPLRAVGEILGKDVGWDSNTSTASINDKDFEHTEKPKEQLKKPEVEKPKEESITNSIELRNYLQANFGTLDTVIGKTEFDISISENGRSDMPQDYWIRVAYDFNFFEFAQTSNKYTKEQKEKLKTQLRDHMGKLGQSAVSIMPNKKIGGSYHYSYYKYPNLKMDLVIKRYYSWKNYDDSGISWEERNDSYEKTKPSHFMWDEKYDDKL